MAQSAIARWSNPDVILVATNLFEGYSLMLHAIYQAKLSNAKVLLVHVIPPSYLTTESREDELPFALPNPVVRTVKTKLDEAAMGFRREGVECEPIILRGLPEEQIPLLAKSRSVDRVIVATRTASGVARLVQGSVSEGLMTSLDIPVCVIGRRTHPGPACGTPLRRILLATSLHRGSSQLASFARSLAELNHSNLVFLHVLDTLAINKQQRELAQLAATPGLVGLAPNEAHHTHEPSFLIREGNPASVIVDEVESMSPDLVILGSPQPSVASWSRGESVVHRVVAEAGCPVITMKRTSASAPNKLHDAAGIEFGLVNAEV